MERRIDKSEDLESQFAECFEKMSAAQCREAIHYMQYLIYQTRKLETESDSRKRVDVGREFLERPVKTNPNIPAGNAQFQADLYQSGL